MRLNIVGAGRAGGSLALASVAAGHEVVGVVSRTGKTQFGPSTSLTELPEADLLLICVPDDQIESVVQSLTGNSHGPVVAHISGFVPTTVLSPLTSDWSVGGCHPLQTLPDPTVGSASLPGAYVGIEGVELAYDTLTHFGLSLGMHPFRLSDEVRPLYHAAAAAAANFVVTALATSADLLDAADIETEVTKPLVNQVVKNVFEVGARSALTGPIARGDTETVVGHLVAAHQVSDSVGQQFRLLAEATAILAGRYSEVENWK
jgi:predicted short-subunit dehydrogenase-like oxidoreductase (DUF2520 family)